MVHTKYIKIIKEFKPINKYTFFIFKMIPFLLKKYNVFFKNIHNIHLIDEFPFLGINAFNVDYQNQRIKIRKEILSIVIKSWLKCNNLKGNLKFYYLYNNENLIMHSKTMIANFNDVICYPLYHFTNYNQYIQLYNNNNVVVALVENIIDELIPRLFIFKNYSKLKFFIINNNNNIIAPSKEMAQYFNNISNVNDFIIEYEYYNKNHKWHKLFEVRNKEIIFKNLD